jgi:hypothetical protein
VSFVDDLAVKSNNGDVIKRAVPMELNIFREVTNADVQN